MQVSVALFTIWLRSMDSEHFQNLLTAWLENAKSRTIDPEDDYYNGTILWNNKPETNPFNVIYPSGGLFIKDHTSGILQWDYFEEPIPEKKLQYKVLDFDDNILGEAFDLDEALKIFNQRYAYFKKQDALNFIEKI